MHASGHPAGPILGLEPAPMFRPVQIQRLHSPLTPAGLDAAGRLADSTFDLSADFASRMRQGVDVDVGLPINDKGELIWSQHNRAC